MRASSQHKCRRRTQRRKLGGRRRKSAAATMRGGVRWNKKETWRSDDDPIHDPVSALSPFGAVQPPAPAPVWSQLSHDRLDPANILQEAFSSPPPPTPLAPAYASRPLYQSWQLRDAAPTTPAAAADVDAERAIIMMRHRATNIARRRAAAAAAEGDEDDAAAAIVHVNGSRSWRQQDGKLHRDGDRPAFIGANGSKEWYQHGKRHREGNQPAQIGANGTRVWYLHGVEVRRENRAATKPTKKERLRNNV